MLDALFNSQRPRQRGRRIRACIGCGKRESVRVDNPAEKCGHCSRKVSLATARRLRYARTPRHTSICAHCGKTFNHVPSQGYKHCSRACRRAANTVERVCKRCAAIFRVFKSILDGKTNSSGNFCSRECYNLFLCKGDDPRGRGPGWNEARREALRRNPFCALCGTFKRLDVHHIVRYRLSRDNSQENLIPLCRKCHVRVEHLYLKEEPQLRDHMSPRELLWWRRFDLIGMQNLTRFWVNTIIEEVNGQAQAA